MERFTPDFLKKLKDFDFHTLEKEKDSVYAVSPALELIYFNNGWVDFAVENSSSNVLKSFPIGRSILEGFSGDVLKQFYVDRFKMVEETGEVSSLDYQCSSVETYREFRQTIYKLRNNLGFLVQNSLKIFMPTDELDLTNYAPSNRYVQANGFISQCSNCRKVLRADHSEIWDWIPEWVRNMPDNLSHSICPPCYDYYWKNPVDGLDMGANPT